MLKMRHLLLLIWLLIGVLLCCLAFIADQRVDWQKPLKIVLILYLLTAPIVGAIYGRMKRKEKEDM